MAALTSGRCLAGSRAFKGLRPSRQVSVSNGCKVFMKRKDSFMVEVNVGDDEPEDIAVRKFMKKVMDSRAIDQLRNRRYKETPRDEFKRRTRERIERIKAKVVDPTWEEEYGPDQDVKPFQDFFPSEDRFLNEAFNDVGFFNQDPSQDDLYNQGGYLTDAGAASSWGQYVNPNQPGYTGGYLAQTPAWGNYNDQQQQQQWAAPAEPAAQPPQ